MVVGGSSQGREFQEDTRHTRGIEGVHGCACDGSQGKQYTEPPPDSMQMGGGMRGQKDEGTSLKNGVWKGVGKTSHQDTHRRVVVVCLYVSVCSGRGGVDSRRDEVMVIKSCPSF